jgi:hypothetical protein
MSYATDHAQAYADILAAGQRGHAASGSDRAHRVDRCHAVTPSTVAGAAMKVRGNPKIYRISASWRADAPTLLFATRRTAIARSWATSSPGPGTVRVKSIDETDPDGAGPIVSRLVVAR